MCTKWLDLQTEQAGHTICLDSPAGVIKDPTTVMLAIVLTGLEEVVMRSTMVYRDNLFRWLQGLPERTEDELKLEYRMWSASTAMGMYHVRQATLRANLHIHEAEITLTEVLFSLVPVAVAVPMRI